MKKFLLTLATVSLSFAASYADVTLSASQAKDVEGTLVPAAGNTAEHFQPVSSLKIGEYSFTFTPGEDIADSQNPAFYPGEKATIRLYKGSQLTISKADENFQKIVFDCKSLKGIDDNITANVGSVSVNKTVITWTRPASEDLISAVTLSLPYNKGKDGNNPNVQISTITLSDNNGGDEPDDPDDPDNPDNPGDAVASSIKEFYSLGAADNSLVIKGDFELTVTYVNGVNCYVTDGETPSMFYGATAYKTGDIVPSGWTGTYSPYNGLPEIKPVQLSDAVKNVNVEYPTFSLAEVNADKINAVIFIKEVTFDEATPSGRENFTGKNDDVLLTFRNNFSLPSVEAGTYKDVLVAVSTYNDNLQVYPISYSSEEKPDDPVKPDDPSDEDSVIYSGILTDSNDDGFTYQNDLMPETGLDYVWSYDTRYGIKASAYVDGVRFETKAWAISPVIDLAGYKDVKVSFEQAANFFNDFSAETSTWIRIENEDWEPLAVENLPSGDSWTFVKTGDIALDEYTGKKIQFGFYYTSTETNSGTWEIRNLKVTGTKDSAVSEISVATSPEFFNLQGVRVNNPSNGIFIRRQGNKVSKVIIK